MPFKLKTNNTEQTLFELAKSKLGIRDLENYTLLIQKQSGVETRTTTTSLNLPSYKNIVWSSHEDSTTLSNQNDEFVRFIIENNN